MDFFRKKWNVVKLWYSGHHVFHWIAYKKWLETIKKDRSAFVPYAEKPYKRVKGDAKIFAYYLTQYHAISENDEAHGKGFTEWQNVVSCVPHYVGEYQPKIPYDLGFYNLLMPGVMERQVEIAKTYGIYGFCFYYYWFSGRKVLEKPLEYWLRHKEIDFNYHFCWANENWSKLWDGGNQEAFLIQQILPDDADKFFNDILPYIKDERYEKIDNKPILMIYRPGLYPQNVFIAFIKRINELAKEHGFDGFYTTSSNYRHFYEPKEWGLDGITEFPPHVMRDQVKRLYNVKKLFANTSFHIYDPHEYIKERKFLYDVDYDLYKACFPCWDNMPRKAWSGALSFLLTDEDFEDWLTTILEWTALHHAENKQYVYINAWNEWGEGAILEPTVRYGYKYLQIVRNCLEKVRAKK